MISRDQTLGHLPAPLRIELLAEYDKVTTNYRESRWEASELNGGRFCEIVYSILEGYTSGSYPKSASKPRNFKRACESLENQSQFSDSVRMTIPRVLVGLYDIRNRRGVGHVGGDVDANQMDAEYVLHAVQWIMAELVRIFHSVSVNEASDTITAIVERTNPLVWEINGKRRILKPGMSLSDSTLLLIYSSTGPVSETDLADWLEQDRLPNYRRVLTRLHSQRMIEYSGGVAVLSPLGTTQVEEHLLTP
ncbi:hypothetical protein [Gordonia sp. i37]|uniref:hypothetical protein n=1 Tax=Gordonia sp. i37 TaxID=1961707 RepID=UPI0009D5C97F|nr:hypothetical protein [Gordonia sp. i37]OPX14852.1 hypothetical protein B1964_12795 [Gordonia sp. i37]